MLDLPINAVIPEIQSTLLKNSKIVLQAPPGAGKTTAVPIALLDQPWLNNKQIIMLEPRRIAARNAASRMAFLLGEKVGETVGYQIKQDKKISNKTKILVVTEGILTRKLQADPDLATTALVIFDEFHERSIHADLSLALCLQSQQILREDLKILVMSATLNTDAISGLLGDAPIIQSEGRSFPIDIHYLDKSLPPGNQTELLASLSKTVSHVIKNHDKNCLIFLPGVKEITQLADQIKQIIKSEAQNNKSLNNILLAPLHGSLSKEQQDKAISPPPAGKRKIVLATNIAETSLTIEGINCVIDSGLERALQYHPASGLNRLITQFISQDSSIQRSGRAGRLSAGVCYRLWTEQQQKRLLKHATAEILHSDLSSLVLEICNWGSAVNDLQWMDIPPSSACDEAYTLLRKLNAIDKEHKITPHGKNILNLGSHPRLAHMMLAAEKIDQSYHACLIAALLTEKDIYLARAEKTVDIHDRLQILTRSTQPARHNGINNQQCKRVIETARQFHRRLNKHNSSKQNIDDELSGVILAYAYPDRIAKQRNNKDARYLLSNGRGASIPVFLQKQSYEYLAVANLDSKNAEATIYLAAEISLQQIEQYLDENIEEKETISWNEKEQRVESKQTSNLGKLVLRESLFKTDDKTAVHQCLLQAIKNTGLQCFNWTEQALNLQQRVLFIKENAKKNTAIEKQLNNKTLPDFSEENLLHTLDEWLLPFLKSENSFKQLQKVNLYNLLFNQLSWEQQQLIEQLAPERVTVPSGSSIRIDYSDVTTPVLAVRLQEVFGLNDTPSVLNGNIKLMMHLLSPARRPMQVTQDLNSFWKSTYHEVKKELRGKYKRHYWPDDPFTAQATSKTKKQMNRN